MDSSSSASTVVLVPGLDGTGELFEPFVRALDLNSAPLIVRYGTVRKPFASHVDDVVTAVRQQAGPVVLVAESFGGPVAVAAAARLPQNVRGLMLVATFVTPPTASLGATLPLFRLVAPLPVPNRVRAVVLKFMLAEPDVDPTFLRQLVAVNDHTRAGLLAHRMALLVRVDERVNLQRLHCPVVYVGGTADRIVPVRRHARQIQELRSDAHVELIPDAPHMLLQCRAQRCAQLARELMGRS